MTGLGLIVRTGKAGFRALTKTEQIAAHLTRADLEAAKLERAGRVVKLKPDGTPYNHLKEVSDAQRGLLNRIDEIKNRLGYPGIDDVERQALTKELSDASRLLDYSERYLPR